MFVAFSILKTLSNATRVFGRDTMSVDAPRDVQKAPVSDGSEHLTHDTVDCSIEQPAVPSIMTPVLDHQFEDQSTLCDTIEQPAVPSIMTHLLRQPIEDQSSPICDVIEQPVVPSIMTHLLRQPVEDQSSPICDVIEQPAVPSIMTHLFEDQSSPCDVIIKVGLWEQGFHWRILVESPFFEAIHRSNFVEKQTGIVELHGWSAPLVEWSLLFLYGRDPEVTGWNVDEMLDIAEFLFIPDLKRACVDFLSGVEVTFDNYMHLLELSSRYDVELMNCQRFILGHLPEVLQHDGLLNTTTESLKMLLGDPKLSYVPVQSWFDFIIRWVRNTPDRLCHFVDLLNMLDFSGCDSDFINSVVGREPLVMENKDDLKKLLTTSTDDQDDTVIIFKPLCSSFTPLTCLNLRTNVLHRNGMYLDNLDMIHSELEPVRGVKNSMSSCIYKVNQGFDTFSVITHDLSTAQSSFSDIVITDTDDTVTLSDIHTYSLANDMLAVVFNSSGKAGSSRRFVSRNVWGGGSRNTSTVHLGRLGGPVTEVTPVVTLRNRSISDICCGDNGTIAMLTSDRDHLFIYDEPAGQLDCVQLGGRFRFIINPIHLAAFKDGFVLYDEDVVVCISRVSEPDSVSGLKYIVKEIMWEKKCDGPSCELDHYFDGERWYQYQYGVSLEYVSHTDLTTAEDTVDLPWISVPIPRQHGEIPAKLYAVSVPKGTLKCHISCPHCKLIEERVYRESFYNCRNDDSGDVVTDEDYVSDEDYESDADYFSDAEDHEEDLVDYVPDDADYNADADSDTDYVSGADYVSDAEDQELDSVDCVPDIMDCNGNMPDRFFVDINSCPRIVRPLVPVEWD